MPRLIKDTYEAFARARAEGLSPKPAAVQAGFAPSTYAYELADRPEVAARVTEILREAEHDALSDPEQLIDKLMDLAEKAGAMNSAAAMTAAKGLYIEAAKMRAELRARSAAEIEDEEFRPRMSEEEWFRTYAPPK